MESDNIQSLTEEFGDDDFILPHIGDNGKYLTDLIDGVASIQQCIDSGMNAIGNVLDTYECRRSSVEHLKMEEIVISSEEESEEVVETDVIYHCGNAQETYGSFASQQYKSVAMPLSNNNFVDLKIQEVWSLSEVEMENSSIAIPHKEKRRDCDFEEELNCHIISKDSVQATEVVPLKFNFPTSSEICSENIPLSEVNFKCCFCSLSTPSENLLKLHIKIKHKGRDVRKKYTYRYRKADTEKKKRNTHTKEKEGNVHSETNGNSVDSKQKKGDVHSKKKYIDVHSKKKYIDVHSKKKYIDENVERNLKKKVHICSFCSSYSSKVIGALKKIEEDSYSVEEKQEYKCNYCKYRTLHPTLLKLHLCSIHSIREIYKCQLCKFITFDKCAKQKHMERKHHWTLSSSSKDSTLLHPSSLNSVRKLHKCTLCRFITFEKCDKQKHMETIHGLKVILEVPKDATIHHLNDFEEKI